MADFRYWGYRWGYKVGLHFWKSGVTKVGFGGGRYHFFKDRCVFSVDTLPLNATRFLNFTLLNSAISGSLLCFGDVNGGGEIKRERTRGRGDTLGWSGRYYQTRRTGPMMVLGDRVIPSFFFGYFNSDMISINQHTMFVVEK